jgi:hypothetical protein
MKKIVLIIVVLSLVASLAGLFAQKITLVDCGLFENCPPVVQIGFPVPISGSTILTDYLFVSAFATNLLVYLVIFSMAYYIYSKIFKKSDEI